MTLEQYERWKDFALRMAKVTIPPILTAGVMRLKFLDFDARRDPKTKHFCIKCQKDLERGTGYRTVRVNAEAMVLHPADYAKATEKEFPTFLIGSDCAKKLGLGWTKGAE